MINKDNITNDQNNIMSNKEFKENETDKYINIYDNIHIIFIEPESLGNIGFIARVMANFGLKNLVLINPPKLEKEAYYYAVHAQNIVKNAKIYKTLDESLKSLPIEFVIGSTGKPGGSYNLSRIAMKPDELNKTINFKNKIAILFGREGNGLNNNEIEKCDIIVSIPTNKLYPVMNVSHAVAIMLYELFKDKNEFSAIDIYEAKSIEKEYLLSEIEEVIETLNLPKHKKRTSLKSFKNIISRAFITGREAHTLKGLFRKIKLKLKNK
ncbi:MAG: RNA methyltransferase [Methanobrevibacter sp.]|jgi:TrmH family RNA methyltransferase|nr:RNA methyltransferase [Methanobrevibacter sp.]